ncbi:hypothetical protein C8R45DRAFT_949978 [Mycena sanguinolenta]|nr:hypothetical protein C8R45DRAFT_949978 [Mycena sanguinolenta]
MFLSIPHSWYVHRPIYSTLTLGTPSHSTFGTASVSYAESHRIPAVSSVLYAEFHLMPHSQCHRLAPIPSRVLSLVIQSRIPPPSPPIPTQLASNVAPPRNIPLPPHSIQLTHSTVDLHRNASRHQRRSGSLLLCVPHAPHARPRLYSRRGRKSVSRRGGERFGFLRRQRYCGEARGIATQSIHPPRTLPPPLPLPLAPLLPLRHVQHPPLHFSPALPARGPRVRDIHRNLQRIPAPRRRVRIRVALPMPSRKSHHDLSSSARGSYSYSCLSDGPCIELV